jgi:hypothetical protein
VFFRSATAGTPDWGEGQPAIISLAGAVHASTNAPVNYFDAPAVLPLSPDRYWDGGVTGCNNPAVVAIIEAIVLGHSPQDIRLLSLGTGNVCLPLADVGAPPSPFEAGRLDSSLPADIMKLATAIVDDPPDAATFIAHVITGGSAGLGPPVVSRVVRMCPLIAPLLSKKGKIKWTAPGNWPVAQWQYLCSIDMDAVQQFDIVYIDDYCSLWHLDLAPNQPIRANGNTFDPEQPEIGYAKFSQAYAAWGRLFQPPSGPTA